MSLNVRQRQIFRDILSGIQLAPAAEDAVEVAQSVGTSSSALELDDFATAMFAALGVLNSEIGQLRGLPRQLINIDRRHAGMMFNSAAYFFRAGWQVDISAVHTPVNKFYRTNDDRWVFFNGAYPHLRDALLRFLGCANDATAIAKAVAKWDAQTLEDTLGELNLCAAILRSPEEWLAHPQGQAISPVSPIQLDFNKSGAVVRTLSKDALRPLQGVKVLDFTHVIAGPTVGRLLAEQGADVIHVQYPYHDSIEGFDLETSFGKKCVYLDLNNHHDQQQILDLASETDVFIDGFRYGALEKHGLSAEALWERNSGLVTVEINCYGFEGPWARRRGWEQLAQTATGLAYRHTGEKQEPCLVPAYFSDYATGCLAAIGAIAALTKRCTDRCGCRVRVSLARTAMLGLEYCENSEVTQPIIDGDLNRYLVDQESPHGLLTRIAPVAQLDQTPPYAFRPASFPGTASLDIRWDVSAETEPRITHVPTRIFRDGLAHWRGRQEL